jgi:Sec-independent protein secretion pathway component TatC
MSNIILAFIVGVFTGVGVVLWEVRKTLTDDLTSTERKVVYTLLNKKARKIFTKFK